MAAVIFAAGGTGGHIVPALAVADALRRLAPEIRVTVVGVGKEIEEKLIGPSGCGYETIPFPPFRGRGLGGVLKFFAAIPIAMFRTRKIFREKAPRVVVGFGGYPSFMPVCCGYLSGVPVLLHEQNVQVGMANRILSRLAREVFSITGAHGFPRSAAVRYLPLPVREEFLRIAPWKQPEGKLSLLVVGGSQGAVSLNSAVISLVEVFQELGISLTHQTGKADEERVREKYREAGFEDVRVLPFIDDMPGELARAHLVISRAGASAVAETTAAGRPAIYVPLPIAGGHQAENCSEVVARGGAMIVRQEEGFERRLRDTLRRAVQEMEGMASKLARSEESPANTIAGAVLRLTMTPH